MGADRKGMLFYRDVDGESSRKYAGLRIAGAIFRRLLGAKVSFLQKMHCDTVFMRQWGCRPVRFYEIWFWGDTV
ncbi:hypothetical protein [Thalassospira sp. MCCC 1A01428]|uniref:hypothetical protein n=1 Tax=Thalassospira sp. MCCC 1A01428 TaxID=1470575 RepID=UPI00111C67BD|nr:hypothetical protein [Thalassospira sp. MCCC 1A01428]